MAQLPIAPKTTGGNWVQTEREAHEAWAALIGKSPKAAQLMHILTARVGENNAVIISQKNLMRLMDCSRRTIQRALNALSSDRWIEVAQVGETGTINAYILNDRIVWHGARDNLRYSL
ncbi:MAG: helix-turn-helix domain-containing protein, partial [Acinetobacter baumannii]|nr:helix-turn-helix domain-containing protein [Acinetobacter baumannii]